MPFDVLIITRSDADTLILAGHLVGTSASPTANRWDFSFQGHDAEPGVGDTALMGWKTVLGVLQFAP